MQPPEMISESLLQEVRAQLRPLAEAAAPSPQLLQFCRYYHIDFATTLPQVNYTAGTVSSGEFTLAAHQWQQAGATSNLLLIHGYLDHTGLYDKLIAYGLSRNCNVLMFDLPGHGLSSGESVSIGDFADYGRAVGDVLHAVPQQNLPLWVMAQSTGGAALVNYAGSGTWPFAATVLLAPLIRPAGWLGMRVAHSVLSPFIDTVPRSFAKNSSDEDFLKFLQQDPLQSHRISVRWIGALRRWLQGLTITDLGVGPALIIQGDKDGTVDWRYNIPAFKRLMPVSQIEYLAGAGHQLANESAELRRRYMSVIDNYLVAAGIDIKVPQE